MKIRQVTIRGFRGFRNEQTIQLDRNYAIIYGLNGSGKSSFTEAIEWLYFGEISRQRLSRCRSEYQHEEYLRNLFYEDSDNPFVEVQGSIQGKDITVRKELQKGKGRFLIDGVEAENLAGLGLNLESYFRPMLAQTEIKALVDTEQKDRWEQLSSILGQDDLTRLREHLMNLRNSKRDQAYKQQENRLSALVEDLSQWDSLAQLRVAAEQRNGPELLKSISSVCGSHVADFDAALKSVQEKQRGLLETELGQLITNLSYRDTDVLDKECDALRNNLEALREAVGEAGREGYDHVYLDFLEKGKQFVKDEICPFCREKTLSPEKYEEIEGKLESAGTSRKAKSKAESLINTIKKASDDLASGLEPYLPAIATLKLIAQKLSDLGRIELVAETQSYIKEVQSLPSTLKVQLPQAIEAHNTYLERVFYHKQKDDPTKLEKPDTQLSAVMADTQDLIDKWIALKSQLSEVAPPASSDQQQEVKRWLLVERVVEFFKGSGSFRRKAAALEKVDAIQQKLENFERAEVQRLLEEHGEEIGRYYNLLNQGERIQFAGIEVKGGARRQAKLKAEAYGKDVNPVTFFSEAHTNSLALSIYFPQRVDRNTTWEIVILDDPVQSMDENHSQALIEILAELSTKKQVIVLTHSKSFFKRLVARMRHAKPIVYQFYSNDDFGPKISLDEAETLTHLTSVEAHAKKGDANSLESASNSLRKAIESVLIEFLLERGVAFSKTQRLQKKGLGYLFSECESTGMQASETGKLKSLLDVSDPDSHAWSLSDTTKGGLRTGAKIVLDIYQKLVDPVST